MTEEIFDIPWMNTLLNCHGWRHSWLKTHLTFMTEDPIVFSCEDIIDTSWMNTLLKYYGWRHLTSDDWRHSSHLMNEDSNDFAGTLIQMRQVYDDDKSEITKDIIEDDLVFVQDVITVFMTRRSPTTNLTSRARIHKLGSDRWQVESARQERNHVWLEA